jgi:hypothetical protein
VDWSPYLAAYQYARRKPDADYYQSGTPVSSFLVQFVSCIKVFTVHCVSWGCGRFNGCTVHGYSNTLVESCMVSMLELAYALVGPLCIQSLRSLSLREIDELRSVFRFSSLSQAGQLQLHLSSYLDKVSLWMCSSGAEHIRNCDVSMHQQSLVPSAACGSYMRQR